MTVRRMWEGKYHLSQHGEEHGLIKQRFCPDVGQDAHGDRVEMTEGIETWAGRTREAVRMK